MLQFRKARETLFGMQFVLTDGMKKNNANPMRSLMILFIIDVLQVFRVMLSPNYGWNQRTYDLAKHVDMVFNVTTLLSLIIHRVTFFGIGFLLVGFALGNAFYCARIFKGGEIHKIGPIKTLRFMVAVVVTTLFSSVMKWLLIPLECLVSEEGGFTVFQGTDKRCTPFAFPEILVTVPTLVVIVFYAAFAITVAFFSLGTNPLACAPHVQFTGRVEVLFIVSKILVTFLPFLSETITPVAASTILCAVCLTVLRRHLRILPFHHLLTNMLRGGIYFSISWLSLSSVIVATFDSLDVLSEDTMQTMQWLLVGCTLLMFPVGILLVWRRRCSIDFSIDRLRGEFELQNSKQQGASRVSMKKKSVVSPRSFADLKTNEKTLRDLEEGDNDPASLDPSESTLVPPEPVAGKAGAKPRGALEQFFNPSWERKRAFITVQDGLSAIRALLMTRRQAELPFLRYMMSRAVEEHPENHELQVLNISLLRFVFCQTAESSQAEKRLRTSHSSPAVDHEYVMYAIKRKAAQDYAAASIGNGHFNAINLMEFDSGMQQARTAHMQCIGELRKFWAGVSSSRKWREKEGLQQLIARLVKFNRSVTRAKMEYQTLLEKYPQSSQLISTYCSFCDTVLNDPMLANELRAKANAINDDAEDEEDPSDKRVNDPSYQAALEQRSLRSATSGTENDDYRVKIQKSFSSWSAEIFGAETKQLMWVARRLKLCFLILFLCSAAGFGVMQFFLFESYAQRDSHRINQTGLLRTLTANALFNLRSQLMAAYDGDRPQVEKFGQKILDDAKRLQIQHWDNYERAGTARVKSFYSNAQEHGIVVNVPYVSGWQVQIQTFWNFGNDLSRRMIRASTATLEQLLSKDFNFEDDLPESKMNMIFITENAFRVMIPTIEEAVLIYEAETKNLWALTQAIVFSSTGVTLLTLLAMCLLVVLRLLRTIGALQHLHLACQLAIALPLVTTRKIAKFYQDVEEAMCVLVDEEEAKRALECADEASDDEKRPADGELDEESRAVEMQSQGAPAIKIVNNLMIGAGVQGMTDFSARAQVHAKPRRNSLSQRTGKTESAKQVLSLSEDNVSMWTKQVEQQVALGAGPSLVDPPKRRRNPNRRVSLSDLPHQTMYQPTYPEMPDEDAVQAHLFDIGVSASLNLPEDSVAVGQPEEASIEAQPALIAQAEGSEEAISRIPAMEPEVEEEQDGPPLEEPEVEVHVGGDVEREREHAGSASGAGDDDGSTAGDEGITPVAVAIAEEEEGAVQGAVEHDKAMPSELGGSGSHTEEVRGSKSSKRGEQPSAPEERPSLIGKFSGILRRAQQGSWRMPKLIDGGTLSDERQEARTKGSKVADDDTDRLPLREVPEETATQIWECIRKHQRFSARTWVWIASLVLIVALSMLLNWFPARRMSTLVTLAPTINQAGRRRTLTRLCAHLTRELVINDGFARMEHEELADALNFYLGELRRANNAVRLGGDLGIEVGADSRNAYHNQIMYGEGCPWRENPSNCSYPPRPDVASSGLYQLSLTFMDAVQSVLDRFGPPRGQWTPSKRFLEHPRLEGLHDYDVITYNATRTKKILAEDEDVTFILDNFAGDLFKGYAKIVELFDEELKSVVNSAMDDNKSIFIVFVLVTFGGIYFLLFCKAVKEALNEAVQARTFVARIPAHTLSPLEIETLTFIFQGRHCDAEDEAAQADS